MFLKSAWYVAGWMDEFEAGQLYARRIIDEPLVLMRREDGTLVALEDRCPHRWAPLSLGRIEDDTIRCMYHGVRFATNGRCVEVPGQTSAPGSLKARTYPVVEQHKWAWIWMGDAEQADISLIPDVRLLDRDDVYMHRGELNYAANYNLINDNLLDLSHVAFVHEKTIGRKVEGDDEPNVVTGAGAQPLPRGVSNNNWSIGRTAMQAPDAPVTDQWMWFSYLVPGIFINHFRTYPAGTAERLHFAEPSRDLECLSDTFSIQAVTPLTERSTRYIYSGAHRKSDMTPEAATAIFGMVDEAFREDTAMIEAQQRMIDTGPSGTMGWIQADRGLSLFRKVLDRLSTEEREAAAALQTEPA
jgi:vanillate O-demethylase monooxygenase subunit